MEQRLLQWARRHPNSPHNGDNSSVSSQNGVNASSYTSTKKKSNPMKEKNISNYVTIKEDCKFNKWINDVTAIVDAEGTSDVFDPDYAPTQTKRMNSQPTRSTSMPCYARHRETGIIENILSKTKDGQEAVKMIMLEYSDQHAGRARAEELPNKLNTARIPEDHKGQVAACICKFEESLNEHNSMVLESLKIDDCSKFEKLKDFTSYIDNFDTVEDSLLMTPDAHNPCPLTGR